MRQLRNTYALSLACADVVRETDDVVRVTHKDGSLDGVEGIAAESGTSTTAEGVVDDLAALGVADKHNLGIRAALVEAGDSRDHSLGTPSRRLVVADASALALAAAGRVVNGLAG
jgi:hypothetical protein